MVAIPPPTRNIATMIDAHHAATPEPPRPHMGVSQLGHPCDRWLWLKFRWAVIEKFDGRMRRLFRRGHNEEPTVLADLRAIGLVLADPPEGKAQHVVDFGSHVSGSLDFIVESGVPEAPNKRHVGEIKTHSRKSFDEVEKQGVEKAKRQHYVQMQVYMHGTGIDRALYIAVCKDDDRLYVERVRYDKALAEKYVARGQRLAIQDEQPPPLTDNPTWYECKMCAAHSWCHGGVGITLRNCRTCAHSTALPDSTFRCEKHNDVIPLGFQRQGCDAFEVHDHLMPF
jgi:hypothetical protein